MSLRKQFATDQKKELEGVRLSYAPNDDKTTPTFIISRQTRNNVKWMKTYEQVTRPYRHQLDRLDPMLSAELNMQIFCKSLLLGWEHIQDEQGKEIEFNYDNAMKLFRELPDLFTELNNQSQQATMFREDEIEAETKN